MSAYELFQSCGVSKRLYDTFLSPMLLVTLFAPPTQLSAAAALGEHIGVLERGVWEWRVWVSLSLFHVFDAAGHTRHTTHPAVSSSSSSTR